MPLGLVPSQGLNRNPGNGNPIVGGWLPPQRGGGGCPSRLKQWSSGGGAAVGWALVQLFAQESYAYSLKKTS